MRKECSSTSCKRTGPWVERSLPLKFGYHIVSGEDTAGRDDVVAFRNWLLAEAARQAKKKN